MSSNSWVNDHWWFRVWIDIPELLPNQHGQAKTSDFLQEVVDIMIDYIRKNNDRTSKVCGINKCQWSLPTPTFWLFFTGVGFPPSSSTQGDDEPLFGHSRRSPEFGAGSVRLQGNFEVLCQDRWGYFGMLTHSITMRPAWIDEPNYDSEAVPHYPSQTSPCDFYSTSWWQNTVNSTEN